MCSRSCLFGPFLPVVPFHRAFRQPVFSVQVRFGEHVHGQRAVVFGSLVEPVDGLFVALRDALTIGIEVRQCVLGML